MANDKKKDLIKVLSIYAMPLLPLNPSEECKEYVKDLEKSISNCGYSESYTTFRIDPSFFNKKNNRERFPRMVQRIRNGVLIEHTDIHCKEYVIEIINTFAGASIYKKGEGLISFTLGEEGNNSYMSGQKFVELVTPHNF